MTQPATALDAGNIKGAAFREFILWYSGRFGHERLARAVPQSTAHVLSPSAEDLGVLPNIWYRAEVVHALMDGLITGFAEDELDRIAQDAAIHIMNKTLRGVYRAVFNLLVTPDRYSRHIDKLWSLHYDTGRPVIDPLGPTEHRVRYVDWRSHHPFICRLNMSAAIPIYSAMGCRTVSWSRVACKSKASPTCISTVSWT